MKKAELIFEYKEKRFTESQIKVIIEIAVVAGQVALATLALPFVVPGLDKTKVFVILLGVMLTFVCWVGAVILGRRVKL